MIHPTHTETQKQALRDHLLLGLKINPLEAWKLYGCSKLATRLSEIRNEPKFPHIYDQWKEVETMFGKTKVKEYSIQKFKQ
jgi:hypothetical protein